MERDDLIDMISTLPDSILSHILSLIPTKNAVATSVLSKRWKPLWKAVTNFDFDLDFCEWNSDEECYEDSRSIEQAADEDLEFAEFVNNVMLLHDGGFLNRFRLVWTPNCIPSQVNSWISTAITRNVHELFLYLMNYDDGPFEIPASVFSCDTLQSLELDGNMFISDATVVFLPRLKILKLVSVYFQSEQALQTLIRGCPMLNYLDIQMVIDEMMKYYQSDPHTGINVFTFKISSASVKLLKLSVGTYSCLNIFNEMPHCSLELVASSLEYLNLFGHVSRIFVQGTLSSLVGADFDIKMCFQDLSTPSVCNSLVEAVSAVNFAVGISLSRYALWALSIAPIRLSTKFKRLIRLEAEADCCMCSSLHDFIQSSDSLEVLAIHKNPLTRNVVDGHHHLNWTTPTEVPRCLSNSLKEVLYYSFSGFQYEHEMIGDILQHGRALEVMRLFCDSSMKEDKMFEMLVEICKLQRTSPACKVFFSRHFIRPKTWGTFPKV